MRAWETLSRAWQAAVGDEIARNAWPARFQRDGTLIVHTKDAIWGFELGHRAAEIAERLPGKPALKFVPGPLPEPGRDRRRRPRRGRLRLPWRGSAQAADWARRDRGRGAPRSSSPEPPRRASRRRSG